MRKSKKATDLESPTTSSSGPREVPTSGPLSFTAPVKDLVGALKRIAGFSDAKSTMPILGCVLITGTADGMTLATYNLNHAAVHLATAWHVHGTGQILVNVKSLSEALKRLPAGDVSIRALSDGPPRIQITAGAATLMLDALHPRDYPKLPPIRPEDKALPLVSADATQLIAMIDAVKPAVCRDETRFHLNGILWEATPDGCRMVATDGHRLAKAEGAAIPGFTTKGVIVAADGIAALRKILGKGTCEIAMVGDFPGKLVVRQSGTTVALKMIDAQFPPYDQVIPKDNRRLVTVDRAALTSALDRAALLASDTRGVALEGVPDGLKLTCDHPDRGTASETLPAELSPESHFKCCVNPKYLRDALSQITDGRVTLAFDLGDPKSKHDPALSPILVRGTDDAAMRPISAASVLVVIMPMRI